MSNIIIVNEKPYKREVIKDKGECLIPFVFTEGSFIKQSKTGKVLFIRKSPQFADQHGEHKQGSYIAVIIQQMSGRVLNSGDTMISYGSFPTMESLTLFFLEEGYYEMDNLYK